MAASSRLMITEAERRFPVRIRIAVPPEGLGVQLDNMKWWLDTNCGADNWAMTPSGLRGPESHTKERYDRGPSKVRPRLSKPRPALTPLRLLTRKRFG